jgi:hypothetical protein
LYLYLHPCVFISGSTAGSVPAWQSDILQPKLNANRK